MVYKLSTNRFAFYPLLLSNLVKTAKECRFWPNFDKI